MLRILLFEEMAERAETVRAGLTRSGHEVVATIDNALELLPAIERTRPDLIAIDSAVVVARFAEFERLREELAAAQLQLEERKLVERAKGLLMRARGLSEEDAYHALRRLAMSKKVRLGEIARQLIDSAELLGNA